MTKKELVDYILLSKDVIDDHKSKIKKIESHINQETLELHELMTSVEEKRMDIQDLSKGITECRNWINGVISSVKDAIQIFDKGFPCAIEHEGKLIVVSNSDITIEENFIS